MADANPKSIPADKGRRSTPFIAMRDIYKSYNSSKSRLEILKGINFDIAAGETLAIVGASGIGKSTLLHILGTLDRPDKGSLIYDGQDVFSFNDTKLAGFRNRTVGFVFQFHHLLMEFTSLENTMMPALIRGQAKESAREKAEEILVRVGLRDRLKHQVSKLAGGEQQRVALARALVMKPEILLADEPTGNLDKGNSDQVHRLLVELNQELNTTLIVVTHNMELAHLMSRRVTIADGLLVEAE